MDLSKLIDKWKHSNLEFREAETLINLLIVDNERLESELTTVSEQANSADGDVDPFCKECGCLIVTKCMNCGEVY